MNDNALKCEKCGEDLKPSQYARRKPEGQVAKQSLVCRNYPKCLKAEKEI